MSGFIEIGNTLKKLYRIYSLDVLQKLEEMGYEGLTYSLLEVISFICENEGISIKNIGKSLGLKKQTMTNHLFELEKRTLIIRQQCPNDRRSQKIFLTSAGYNLKNHLKEVIAKTENDYERVIGSIELERLRFSLDHFHSKLDRRNLLF